MSNKKFRIRNLNNELRSLEKRKKKIEEEIQKLEQEPFYEGELAVDFLMVGNRAISTPKTNKFEKDEKYSVKYYKTNKQVLCELTWKPKNARKEIFVGEANCCEEDSFNELKGMNIALLKAMRDAYDYRISTY